MDNILKYSNETLLGFNNSLIRAIPYVPPGPVSPWPTDGLVARWQLSSNLADTGPNNIPQVCTDGSTNYSSGALVFNGTNKFKAASTTLWDIFEVYNKWSVAFWLATSSAADVQGVWGVNGDPVGASYAANWFVHHAGSHQPFFQKHSGLGGDDYSYCTITLGTTMHHFVITFEGSGTGACTMYIDGASQSLTGTSNYTQSCGATYATDFCLGDGNGGGPRVSGTMKYFYVYNRVLTQTEVNTLYNSGTAL